MIWALVLLSAVLAVNGEELSLGKLQPVPAAEAKELLRAVCPGPILEGKDDDNRGEWGCAACPAFADAMWPGTWDLEAIHYGHFSSAKADEAVLAMNGCAPHSLEFGGTVLLVRNDDRWKMKWSNLGLIARRCLSVPRKDGRDLLLCKTDDMHQGIGSSGVFVADLARPSGARQINLLGITDNSDTCGESFVDAAAKVYPLQSADYRRIEFDPAEAKLSIDVEYGWRPYTRANMLACREAQDKNKPLPSTLAPRTKIYRVEFDFNGNRFVVSPASAESKRVVETFHLNHR